MLGDAARLRYSLDRPDRGRRGGRNASRSRSARAGAGLPLHRGDLPGLEKPRGRRGGLRDVFAAMQAIRSTRAGGAGAGGASAALGARGYASPRWAGSTSLSITRRARRLLTCRAAGGDPAVRRFLVEGRPLFSADHWGDRPLRGGRRYRTDRIGISARPGRDRTGFDRHHSPGGARGRLVDLATPSSGADADDRRRGGLRHGGGDQAGGESGTPQSAFARRRGDVRASLERASSWSRRPAAHNFGRRDQVLNARSRSAMSTGRLTRAPPP